MYSLKQLIALMAGVGAGGEISDNPFCVGELTVIKLSGTVQAHVQRLMKICQINGTYLEASRDKSFGK